MQPIKKLTNWLTDTSDKKVNLFLFEDLRSLYPELSDAAFKTLMSRAVSTGVMRRLCRGLYMRNKDVINDGMVLFHAASLLRIDKFNYISLETALSMLGVISQQPMNWITIMSSGRSSKIKCGGFGTIEFVHTKQASGEIANELTYDSRHKMWRASIKLALRDMKAAKRNCDLINWDEVHEFI